MSHQQTTPVVLASRVQNGSSLPVLTHGHRSALEHLGRAFAEARPVAILIGEWKSVTSHLIDRFLAGIEGDVAVARITKPCSDAKACMRELTRAIGLDPKNMKLADLESDFTNFLFYQRRKNRRTIICFEETPDDARPVLDMMRRLVELETKEKFGLMVILSGPPSVNELLVDARFHTICVQAGQRIPVGPFTLSETREFVSREIEAAGIADIRKVFEFEAITLIHELCAGLPDTVDTLCCKCIELAKEGDNAPVTTGLVKKAYFLLRQRPMTQPSVSEAVSKRVNGASLPIGRLVARMNGVVVREQALNHGHILIGRSKLCDIPVTSPSVSRHHALVINSAVGVSLVDLGSTNGTFIGGRPIEQCALQNGDVIAVGDCKIAYVAGDDQQT